MHLTLAISWTVKSCSSFNTTVSSCTFLVNPPPDLCVSTFCSSLLNMQRLELGLYETNVHCNVNTKSTSKFYLLGLHVNLLILKFLVFFVLGGGGGGNVTFWSWRGTFLKLTSKWLISHTLSLRVKNVLCIPFPNLFSLHPQHYTMKFM